MAGLSTSVGLWWGLHRQLRRPCPTRLVTWC
jgi:hypothetical protein